MRNNKNKQASNQLKLIEDDVVEDLPEHVIIRRGKPKIKSLSNYLYDVVEDYKNGDTRVKASDYLKAIQMLYDINNLNQSNVKTIEAIKFELK